MEAKIKFLFKIWLCGWGREL